MSKRPVVSVIGLGKLGACIAASFAHKGFEVIGADVSAKTVEMINQQKPPVVEPQLEEMMAGLKGKPRATQDVAEAVVDSDVTLIVFPTPSTPEGGFSIDYVIEAAKSIGRGLKAKTGYHLVVLTSTVLPGSTEYGMIPVLERESGKRVDVDFGVCYSPEFIALGQVIKDFLNPEFLLIGEHDDRAGKMLAETYLAVCNNEPKIARMNMVATMSEQLPGGDVDVVTGALGLDTRIGSRYLKGAVAYGGPCFPRDNQALAYLARQLGPSGALAEAVHAYNGTSNQRLAERVLEVIPNGGSVAVLGLSYKPDSNVIEEAPGFLLAKNLVESGATVTVHDPMAMDAVRKVLGERVKYAKSVDEAIAGSDVVVITNPDRAYAAIDLATVPKSTIVIDAWRLLRKQAA